MGVLLKWQKEETLPRGIKLRKIEKMAAPTTKKSTQLLEMVPNDKIIFNPPFTSVSTASLMLKNSNASSYVAFKIKTTAPKRYCVRPNSGLLAPDDIMDVKVMLQPGGTDEKHKFQVQTLIVDSDYNSLSNEAKTEAWKNPENPSVGTKLACVFGPEKKLPESIPEEPNGSIPEEKLYSH